jgi:hypothetical protein
MLQRNVRFLFYQSDASMRRPLRLEREGLMSAVVPHAL